MEGGFERGVQAEVRYVRGEICRGRFSWRCERRGEGEDVGVESGEGGIGGFGVGIGH